MIDIAPGTTVVRSSEPLTARIDDEVVMLDTRQGCYFGLDRSGAVIWDLIADPRSVGDVCQELVERYDVPPETCRADVISFLTELADAGLIEAR